MILATSPRGLGAALAALGVIACGAALTIGSGGGAWGERTVPLLAGAIMALGGLAVMSEPATQGTTTTTLRAEMRAASLLLLGAAWTVALGLVGFLVATLIAAPLAFALFGQRRASPLALFALLVPVALYLFFFHVLGVFPPYGRLFDLADIRLF